jgi:6-phospho-3-hexuloisomerase
MHKIIEELQYMWENTNGVEHIVNGLKEAKERNYNIIGIGAGRMGYSLRAFIMRLSHVGYESYFIGDTALPRINKNSVVIINSSSGETPTNIIYAQQAREAKSYIITITTNKDSTIAKLSDQLVIIPHMNSHQLMKTIYEQYTYLLLDYVAEQVVSELNLDRDIITHNHSILE